MGTALIHADRRTDKITVMINITGVFQGYSNVLNYEVIRLTSFYTFDRKLNIHIRCQIAVGNASSEDFPCITFSPYTIHFLNTVLILVCVCVCVCVFTRHMFHTT